ncbi:MAG: hypothetical protein QNJ44_13715 [Rhodobacter sp.]|nr:hypothetical protein [Rhodobacter sp.]
MAETALTTTLAAPIDAIWDALQKPATLIHVSKGFLSFRPVDPPQLPDRWSPGDYRVSLRAFGILPIGQQVMGVEFPEMDPPKRALRDNGSGAIARVWDHWIILEPLTATATRYTDRIRVEAGLITPLIMPWVRAFYAHRQRRWHRLIANDFDLAT